MTPGHVHVLCEFIIIPETIIICFFETNSTSHAAIVGTSIGVHLPKLLLMVSLFGDFNVATNFIHAEIVPLCVPTKYPSTLQ